MAGVGVDPVGWEIGSSRDYLKQKKTNREGAKSAKADAKECKDWVFISSLRVFLRALRAFAVVFNCIVLTPKRES